MRVPRVSISVITYNQARFIRQALDGVLMQKVEFPIEIVVGDDCSTDGTRAIVEEYAREHPGLVVPVLPERNLGDGGRPLFLETLAHSRGELIAMTEGDDYWTCDTKVQRQVDYLDEHPECSLCFHDALVVTDDGSITGNFMPSGHPEFISADHIIRWFCIPSCSPMMRRGVIANLPKWLFEGPCGDLPLHLAAAELGPLGYIDEVMGAYRVHSGGVWSRLSEEGKLRQFVEALDALAKPLGSRHARALAEAKSRHHLLLAAHLARSGRPREAARHGGIAIRHDPALKLTVRVMLRTLANKLLGPRRRRG